MGMGMGMGYPGADVYDDAGPIGGYNGGGGGGMMMPPPVPGNHPSMGRPGGPPLPGNHPSMRGPLPPVPGGGGGYGEATYGEASYGEIGPPGGAPPAGGIYGDSYGQYGGGGDPVYDTAGGDANC
eukprot:m.78875 g.78875  ORF g.78875 m.78875 type:complete len:125 (+) comp8172_c1_seq2:1-375(+)